jgi:hypothetical protein
MPPKLKSELVYLWFAAAFLLALLLLTNRYLSVRDSDVLSIDSYNYLRIATAFPKLPAPNSVLSAHHAQRFMLPYLAGGFSKATNLSMDISFRVFVIAGIILIVGLLVTVLAKISQLSTFQSLWLVALQILNPYSFRIYIANSFLLNDIFFQVGSLVLVLGLLEESVSVSFLGIFVAICSRQTALLLLPPMLVWVTVLWPKAKRRSAILAGVIGTLMALFIYEITSRVAVHMAGTTVSIETVTGLFVWLRASPSIKVIGEFGLRGIIGLALPIAILLATLRWYVSIAKWSREDRLRTGLLLGFAAMIASQPVLGGPAVTGRDITRLVLLALPPLLAAFGIILSYTTLGAEFWQQAFPLFMAITTAASFHHTYSFLGIGTGAERTNRFALVHFTCGILLFLWLKTLILSRSHPRIILEA